MVSFLTNGGNMRKFILCIVAIIAVVACFTACKKNKANSTVAPTSTPVTSESVSEAPAYTVELSHSEVTLSVGETFKLEAVASMPNAYIFWRIQDSSIAKVSDDGTVTALAVGQTICYAKFGTEEAMCLIKVAPEQATPMLSVSVAHQNNSVIMYKGNSLNVNATVKLGDQILNDATIEYVVADTSVVSVTDGVITANGVGTAAILVKVTYNGQEAQVVLNVTVIEY